MNAGVIGVGNMGRHHTRNYAEISGVNLVAISDINPKIGKEIAEKFKCQYYENYKDLLKNEKLDLVTIAVPTKLHKKIALDCITAGVHILIEKPIALNVKDAKEVVEKARQKGVKFTVGHIERFNPAVLKLKEMIDSGKLGEIISVATFRLGPLPPQIKDVNVVVDIGVHDIDIMNWFFSRLPRKIVAQGGKALLKNHEDHVEAFLDYGNGSGIMMANWITPLKVRKLTVSGKKAYVELNYITQELNFYESKVMESYDDFGDFLIKFGDGQDKKTIAVNNIEPLKAEIKSFIKAIKENGRPAVTAREAIDALDIACRIDRMIRRA
ncbi:MAG: oxidoreductase domain protein [Berkelbacteria bacterium GW2011_GWA1_36_9]|uniref:Oxidoreductase domain protein n=1 Tax=Berkelbacteria bacterium GW2011_GWA1_36_9 TaxID=1618331 RepID=A0A0G0FYA5_9BACT|nr:MAG: oxidoreductase domain protein [Berkelbacteria bacterium GW2011_GWA1_36_9]